MHSLSIIVETPRGSAEKYNWNNEEKIFELKKILPLGMIFPFDFGFIPNTMAADGDPVDAIIISELKTFPGCRISCRLIGGINGRQQETKNKWIRNDRYVFIPEPSVVYHSTKKLAHLGDKFLEEIQTFMETYNCEKKYQVLKAVSVKEAWTQIKTQQHA